MGIRVSKNIVLPRADSIKDPEAKRVIQEILKVMQRMNDDYYNDIVHIEGRIAKLEP